jgi:5S rRNA maturation endonuclease (ribonuclease M5)/KaiC/GvpD/RAD55 family RecA-like ATPase
MNYQVEESQAIEFAKVHGWGYKIVGNQLLTDCPICGKVEHFYMNVQTALWDCKVCGQSGNLYQLRKHLGDQIPGLVSMQESMGMSATPRGELPNIVVVHDALLKDESALDYLIHTRKFSMEIIEKLQLGLWTTSKAKYIIYPYVNDGKYLYVKMRCIPPVPAGMEKFYGAKGRENPLFQSDVLNQEDFDELILVEGEGDTAAMMTLGYNNVAGIPGANMKKAVWIDRLDEWYEKRSQTGKTPRIYILYDSDKPGQEAAEEIIKRIGINRCYLIKLPEFNKIDGRIGKDVGEWMVAGHTKEELDKIKGEAQRLIPKGTIDIGSALDEIANRLTPGGSIEPTYITPWPSVNTLLGGAEPGDVVGVIAEGKIGKTTFGLNWIDYLVKKNINCLLTCFEMPPERIARKWACLVTNTDDTPGRSKFCQETVTSAKAVLAERQADLILAYLPAHDKDKVFDLIRQAVRRYGIQVLMLDHLQQMVRSIQHAAQETAVLSRAIKDLSIELNIMTILVVEPKRVEANEIVGARHALGSSSIEKDVDSMIALHRNRIGVIKADDFVGQVQEIQNLSPYMLARVDLTRYSPGGAVTLYMEGAKSLIRELRPDESRTNFEEAQGIGPDVPVEKI